MRPLRLPRREARMNPTARKWGVGKAREPIGKWPLADFGDDQLHRDPTKPFDDPRLELKRLHQTTKLNKFYIPISKLPPLGPDPRKPLGAKAPACYPKPRTSRAQRLMVRWQSMPSLRQQMPLDGLLEEEEEPYEPPPPPEPDEEVVKFVERVKQRREERQERRSKFCEAHEGTRRGGHEFPHIPCSCCDHSTPRTMRSSAPSLRQSGAPSVQQSAMHSTMTTARVLDDLSPASPGRSSEGAPSNRSGKPERHRRLLSTDSLPSAGEAPSRVRSE